MRSPFFTRTFLLFFAISLLLGACSSAEDDEVLPSAFDRKAMLKHYAEDIIRPAYLELSNNVTDLSDAVEAFNAAPGTTRLETLRTVWLKTQLSFEAVNAYNFGPAGQSATSRRLVQEIGTFPVNTEKLEKSIAQGVFPVGLTDQDARGLLAIEYMLFEFDGDTKRVAANLGTASRQVFLRKLTRNLQERVDAVVADWATYSKTFVDNDGTEPGSSISMLFNEFARSYENLQNQKIGRPAGLLSGQTQAQPNLAEGYFSQKSLLLAQAHFMALETNWYGRSASTGGPGFREYLLTVTGGPALVKETEAQLSVLRQSFQDLAGVPSLTTQLQTNKPGVDKLFAILKDNTHLFKNDLASLLGLPITYQLEEGG